MSENQGAMLAIDVAIKMCVDQWGLAVGKAIDEVKPASPSADNTALYYAAIAGAGNMIWAATCLIAPEFAIPIRVLSFGGAGLASVAGVMATLPTEPPPAGPTAQLTNAMKAAVTQSKMVFLREDQISQLKQLLYRKIAHAHPDWIKNFGINEGNIRRTVWEYLFQSPYGDKAQGYGIEQAGAKLTATVETSLKDFYALVIDRYATYDHMVAEDAYTKYPPRFHGYSEMDYNEFTRKRYIAEQMAPTKFNDWLNKDKDFLTKLQAFKSQHLIR